MRLRLLHILHSSTYMRIFIFGLMIASPAALACEKGSTSRMYSIDALNLTLDLGSQDRSIPALQEAIGVLFALDDEPESPLNNALSLAEGEGEDKLTHAKQSLLAHLNRPETKLVLLEGKDDGRGFQPERGESTETNWVFSLIIPSLSDHIYWVVLPKNPQPASKGYVYGFN
ncbi:MAG: hypothetical protein V4655_03985 [Bdellovibrionota bacterium]